MRILAIHSGSTKGATERVKEILGDSVDCFDLSDSKSNIASYQIAFWHNAIGQRAPGRYSVFYPCGIPTQRMIEDPAYRQKVIDCDPNEIWANSRTSMRILRGIMPEKIGIRCMLKPFRLDIPEEEPLYDPKERRILWYWKPNWPYTEGVNDYVVDAMIRVASNGWKIGVISNKGEAFAPVEHPNIEPLGRVDLSSVMPSVYGVVRATRGLDFGRSTYQINAFGRWVMYCNMQEIGCIDVDWEHIPEGVEKAADTWRQEHAAKTWRYIKDNFTEDALRDTWHRGFAEVLNGA